MSKFISKAEEISNRIQGLIDAFQIKKGFDGRTDEHIAPKQITEQYPDILFDVQCLIFCDSPQHPLYIRSLELNERRKDIGYSFQYKDFVTLKEVLTKYIQYRSFLEEGE